jgi:SOS-response transcriptional repressor LexA
MHKVQEQLLALADTENLGSSSYYALAKKLGVANHGSIKFHMDQLFEKGLLFRDPKSGAITKVTEGEKFSGLVSIPIMGEANCGAATSIADDRVQGFLRLSPSLVPGGRLDKLYALKAVGDSMNAANIHGKPVNDGDYVLAERTVHAQSGDYVVSIFDEVANIKRFIIDGENSRIVLLSESTEHFPPIFVAEEDYGSYLVVGKVLQIIPAL